MSPRLDPGQRAVCSGVNDHHNHRPAHSRKQVEVRAANSALAAGLVGIGTVLAMIGRRRNTI